MKFVDEFRDPSLARQLLERIRATSTRCWSIMEVCGGQTHGLLRYGIDDELAGTVELIHGPGCPVCVTPAAVIDVACQLALRPAVTVATFGDMLRVPGRHGSLATARAVGASVQSVYSPVDAVRLAQQQPARQIVFLAVGFETTAPATALAVRQAAALDLPNFSLLVAHVRVQPAMEALAAAPDRRLQGFLAAGHVATVMGYASYQALAARHHVPVVVTGFEPVDLLDGILACVTQLERGEHRVENRYARSVRADGNPDAQRLIDDVYQVADGPWRGLGVVAGGRLELRDEWARFDARRRFGLTAEDAVEGSACRAAEVLTGQLRPPQCAEFGVRCRPDSPLGAPMVSTEGVCAAYYRFHAPPGPTQL